MIEDLAHGRADLLGLLHPDGRNAQRPGQLVEPDVALGQVKGCGEGVLGGVTPLPVTPEC